MTKNTSNMFSQHCAVCSFLIFGGHRKKETERTLDNGQSTHPICVHRKKKHSDVFFCWGGFWLSFFPASPLYVIHLFLTFPVQPPQGKTKPSESVMCFRVSWAPTRFVAWRSLKQLQFLHKLFEYPQGSGTSRPNSRRGQTSFLPGFEGRE